MPASSEDKAAKAFEDAAMQRDFNPYHFAHLVKTHGGYGEELLREAAIAVFLLGEIDYRYNLGDPTWGEMCDRIVDIIREYRDIAGRS